VIWFRPQGTRQKWVQISSAPSWATAWGRRKNLGAGDWIALPRGRHPSKRKLG